MAEFSDEPVANVAADTTPPELVRGEIDGGTVTLYFSEPLDPDSVGGRFQVTVWRSEMRSLSFYARGDVGISDNVVTVGLGPVGQGVAWATAGVPSESWKSNMLWYVAPTNPAARRLRDLAGNPVSTPDSWSDGRLHTQALYLDNVTGAPSVTRVAFSSDAGADRTYARGETIRMTLTFSEAVTVTGAPRVKLGLGAGDERWADYAGGSGTKVLEFAYTVAEGDASDRRRGGAREHAGAERRHDPVCVGRW